MALIKFIKKFIVEKGSIAINGISLTIANVKEDVFYVIYNTLYL